MKKLILSELLLLFLATTFMTDSPPPGWYQQTLPRNDQINDIFFLDSLTGWVVTAGASSSSDTGYIMKTTNGGNNWAIQYDSIMNFNALQFLNSNTGYAGGGNGPAKVYKTTNSGQTWFLVGGSLLGFGTLEDLFFESVDTGWICDMNGFGGLAKTTNGGLNWQLQLNDTYHPKKLFFINSDTGWAISNEATGKLYRTTNGGGAWNLQYTFTTGVGDVFFVGRDTGWITGGPTGILKTTNGGTNWFSQNSPITVVGAAKIYFINNTRGYIGANSFSMDATFDGINWGYQNTPAASNFSVFFADTSKGWSGTSILIHTTDGGGPFVGIKKITSEVPNSFKLYQNYPNPFNPKTNIKYQIPARSAGGVKNSDIILRVFDIQGREITTLVNQKQNPGIYEVDFDGTNYSSGIYLYTLIADGKPIDTKKMVLIK